MQADCFIFRSYKLFELFYKKNSLVLHQFLRGVYRIYPFFLIVNGSP